MTLCAWCGEATGELVVPGRRGAVVHPSCERARGGRRSFLLGGVVLAGAAIAAPLLDLLPETPLIQIVPGFPGVDYVDYAAINALLLEKYRKALPQLYDYESGFYARLKKLEEEEA